VRLTAGATLGAVLRASLILVSILSGMLTVVGANGQEAYSLSVADQLRIRVVEWRASEMTFTEWSEVGGEYVVGPQGAISFPFVGELTVAGQAPIEVAEALEAGLKQALGLAVAPDVTVEIAAFAPIYVAGDVSSPGQYSFAPGLTVIKAISLAGGQPGSANGGTRLERDVIAAQGTLDVLISNHNRLLARRARIQAELAEQTTVPTPEELAQADQEAVVAVEQAILDANSLRVSLNLETLESQRALLDRELETLEQKRVTTGRQLESAREQLAAITALADQGLAISSRVSSLESMVAGLEGHMLDIDTADLRARQDLGGIEQRAIEIRSNRTSELTVEMQQVEREIAELTLRIETQRALVREALALGAPSPTALAEPSYSYGIVRGDQELPATLSTPVRPGDVVVVRMEL
jgi:exopolysaccharide production protein ExoF